VLDVAWGWRNYVDWGPHSEAATWILGRRIVEAVCEFECGNGCDVTDCLCKLEFVDVPDETRERLADWIDREQLAAENRKLRAVYKAARAVVATFEHQTDQETIDARADTLVAAVRAVEES
jgi:hypothetical protein